MSSISQTNIIPLVIEKSVLPASDSHRICDPPASLNFLSLAASVPAAPGTNSGRLLGISRSLNHSRYISGYFSNPTYSDLPSDLYWVIAQYLTAQEQIFKYQNLNSSHRDFFASVGLPFNHIKIPEHLIHNILNQLNHFKLFNFLSVYTFLNPNNCIVGEAKIRDDIIYQKPVKLDLSYAELSVSSF